MKNILTLFLCCGSLIAAVPVITSSNVDVITHSTARITWRTDASEDSATLSRVLYGVSGVSITVTSNVATATFPTPHRCATGASSTAQYCQFVWIAQSATSTLNGQFTITGTPACSNPNTCTVATWATSGVANGTYTDAVVYVNMLQNGDGPGGFQYQAQNSLLTGLVSSTFYDVCPQTSNASGWSAICGSGTNLHFQTSALPSPHPALPTLPTQISQDYPDTTSAVSFTLASDCSDWTSKWASAEASRDAGNTVIVYLPHVNTCVQPSGGFLLPVSGDAFQMASIDYSTNTITVTTVGFSGFSNNQAIHFAPDVFNGWGIPSGLTNGVTYYAVNVGGSPGNRTFQVATAPSGPAINLLGFTFTADVANNRIVLSPTTQNVSYFLTAPVPASTASLYRLSVESTGTLPTGLNSTSFYSSTWAAANSLTAATDAWFPLDGVTLSDAGTGTHTIGAKGNVNAYGYVQAWPPPHSNKIIFRTDAADTDLPPDHVRMSGSLYAPSLAKLAASQVGTLRQPLIQGRAFTHDIYFMGLDITQADLATGAANQFDPPSVWSFFTLDPSNYGLTFARNFVHGLPCPNRVTGWAWYLEGANQIVQDNDIENIETCRPGNTGSTGGIGAILAGTGSTVTVSPGLFGGPWGVDTIPATTITLGGTGSGLAIVTNPVGGPLHVTASTGINVSCVPTCTVTNTASPTFPYSAPSLTEEPIGQILVTSGLATGVENSCGGGGNEGGCPPFISWVAGVSEGPGVILSSYGPGPVKVSNNYIYGAPGITMHMPDDGNYGATTPADETVSRNVITSPMNRIFGQAGTGGCGLNDHSVAGVNACNYAVRNPMEAKTGQRIWFDGNQIFGSFAGVTSSGSAVLLPSVNASHVAIPNYNTVSDFTVTNNLIMGGVTPANASGGNIGNRQGRNYGRVLWKNNITYNMSGWLYRSHYNNNWNTVGDTSTGTGALFWITLGGEDVSMLHNTYYGATDSNSMMLFMWSRPVEGVNVSNNLLFTNEDGGYLGAAYEGNDPSEQPQCWTATSPSVKGRAVLDCMSPLYRWDSNLMIDGWLTSGPGTPTGTSTASTFANAWSGLTNYFGNQSTIPARLSGIGYSNAATGDFRLTASSAYAGNTNPSGDGYPIGADQTTAMQAQGTIQNARALSITSTGVTFYFAAPDSGTACYITTVPHGATTFVGAPRTAANTTASQLRNIAVTGLTTATQYDAYVMCANASNMPMVTFTTH